MNNDGGLASAIDAYFDGIYEGDVDVLATVLHQDVRLVCRRDDLMLGRAEYLDLVASRPSPAERGDPRFDEILSASSATLTTAHARVRLAYLPKLFTDELVLVFDDDRWQIISKTWDYTFRQEGTLT